MRAYQDSDLDPLIEIIRDHLGPYVARHIGPWARSEAMLREEIPAARDDISVVMDGDRLVAFVWLTVAPDWLLLEEIHVINDARGRGLGKQLMEFVEGHARANDRRCIRLTVFRESPAVHFYTRLGYLVVDENTARAQVHMEKVLSAPPQN